MSQQVLPDRVENEQELEELLSRPSPSLISFMKTLDGPLMVIGAGGKMGPSLCLLARRAADEENVDLDVLAVSRFSSMESRRWLEEHGVKTIACDIMDRRSLAGLPDVPNVVYLVGMKFGTKQDPAQTWAVNALAPAHVAERYPDARIVALSTGNVYPLGDVSRGGSLESDDLTPLGEYANAAVARERIFQYYSERQGTPTAVIRLNYAVDLRYGVLVDIARKVAGGQPVDVTMGYFNCIWQRDANDMIIRSLEQASSPPTPLNLTGGETLSVRKTAERMGELMGGNVTVVGEEASTALLSNAARTFEALGEPATPIDKVIEWTADWVDRGKELLGKPTHFEVRDGRY